MNKSKQLKIISTAENYISKFNLNCLFRFDVISIDGSNSDLIHIENDFY